MLVGFAVGNGYQPAAVQTPLNEDPEAVRRPVGIGGVAQPGFFLRGGPGSSETGCPPGTFPRRWLEGGFSWKLGRVRVDADTQLTQPLRHAQHRSSQSPP